MIRYVDPGISGCGMALFDGVKLHSASYSRNTEKSDSPTSTRACRMAYDVVWSTDRFDIEKTFVERP